MVRCELICQRQNAATSSSFPFYLVARTGTLTIGMVERPDKAGPCPVEPKGVFYKTWQPYQNIQDPANLRFVFCENSGF